MNEKIKSIAKKLNGIERSGIPGEIQMEARESGLIIAYGASDDCFEMRGFICEEWSASDGTIVHVDSDGIAEDPFDPDNTDNERLKDATHYIQAVWDPKDKDVSWSIETDLPHEKFNIMEDGEVFCIGMVFALPEKKCPHCAFLETLGKPQSNREYWMWTEMFVYLHGGADHCPGKEMKL